MNKFLLLLFVVFIFGCKTVTKKKDGIPLSKILETELIDSKPYLVLENKIDTLYEIISEGKIGLTEKGDTLRSFINISDTIYAKLNSVMCCTYEYYFKDGLLIYEKINSDYTAINNYKYYSNSQFIYRIDSKNLTDTTIFKLIDDKIQWKLDLYNSMDDTTFYFYESGYLTKKVELYKSILNEEGTKYLSEFKRNKRDNSVEEIIYKGLNTIQILSLDKNGIPQESLYINYDSLKFDTICKTKFQYFINFNLKLS